MPKEEKGRPIEGSVRDKQLAIEEQKRENQKAAKEMEAGVRELHGKVKEFQGSIEEQKKENETDIRKIESGVKELQRDIAEQKREFSAYSKAFWG